MTTRPTRLFTLRLWQETVAAGQTEWRGKLQSLPDGEACYFRGWSGLIGQLEALLAAQSASVADAEAGRWAATP
ncbi:MAG: hypothetical protein K1X65_19255 [Caldilineales bacterium]|nr:hypothetical protein [Caldilineales bacterium]